MRNVNQLLIGIAAILSPSILLAAKPPSPPGNIVFLGETYDGQRSVWLSVTRNGSFEVEAKNQIVDQWTRSRAGLHVTLSPIIPNPHSLFQIINGEMVFIDKDNQQGGITFPPLPGGLPPGEGVPPIVSHPIILPGAPTHPIIKPGTPTHPIIKPGTPTHPIIKPGTPTHPIIKPGTPTHPIVKPGTPTHPIVKPGVPAHPIELPPTGGEKPPTGGEKPPTEGVTPPAEGAPASQKRSTSPVSPSQIEKATPQIFAPPKGDQPSKPQSPSQETNSPTSETQISPSGSLIPDLTPKRASYSAGDIQSSDRSFNNQNANNFNNNGFTTQAPLTEGRRFATEPLINFWTEGRYFYIKDFRFGLDRQGYATSLTIGGDRRISENLIIGAQLGYNNGKSSCFDDNWITSARGFNAGPYFGYRLLKNWSIEGNASFGRLNNHNDISILSGEFGSYIYSGSLIARGIYNLCDIQLQTKPAIYYSYFHNKGYNLNTYLYETWFSVPISSFHCAFGFAQFAVEASLPIAFANNLTLAPFIELGVNYAFVRPNNGQILTGNLTMQGTTPWSGLTRIGIRTLLTRSFFIESTVGYVSIGQNNLDIWQGKIYLSWAF